jgi:low affinity Fe/Cu permease
MALAADRAKQSARKRRKQSPRAHAQYPFTRFAKSTSRLAGRPGTFAIVVLSVVAWAVSGPYFGYSENWQLAINTGTTIVTFLMVFLIQATQNRDAEALQVKLDEIIRCMDGARNDLLDLEELEDEDLMRIHQNYLELAETARKRLKKDGKPDTSVPDLKI